MKIALAQMDVVPGRPDKNVDTMLHMIDEAKRNGVDLIAFPEMCVGGYLLGDRWTEESFCRGLMEFNDIIREASKGIAVAYGNIFVDPSERVNERISGKSWHPNKDGRVRKYNAIYVFQDGKSALRMQIVNGLPKGVQPKTLLPNYRFFDDERYFFSLRDIARDYGTSLDSLLQPFWIRVGGKDIPVGFELCEDLWCNDYREKGESVNPTKILVENGAEYIVNLSASPWTFGKNGARDRRVKELGGSVPFFYVNCVGAQNNGKNVIVFDGGSTVYNSEHEPIVFSNEPYKPELIVVDDSDLTKHGQQRVEQEEIAQKYSAIICGIKHMRDIFGSKDHPKFVIGLSGGIDSSLVAALIVKAVGKENVTGVNMPTEYNSDITKEAAARVAKELGIRYIEMPIGDIVTANEQVLRIATEIGSLTKENIQAKIRGASILSNLAGQMGAIFTNNGNKVEVATGYATLYGDVGGAIAPIADLLKIEVFAMAQYVNEHVHGREVIPAVLLPDELYRFKFEPSAELGKDQKDPFRWGYHDALLKAFTDYQKKSAEDILRWYLGGELESNLGISTELIERWNIDKPKEFVNDLEWFLGCIQKNVFKRVQAPPIIAVSKSAYGYDIRESQLPFRMTNEYGRLKKEVLKMDKYNPEK